MTTLLLWAVSTVALVICVRQLLRILPPSISQIGYGAITVQNILVPIALYRTHKLDNIFALIADALALLFFTLSGVTLLTALAIARLLSAIISFLCLAMLAIAELLFFPIILGARLGRGRPAVELFTLIGWIVTIVGLFFTLITKVLDHLHLSTAIL